MTALELLRRERSALIACNTVYNSAGKSTGLVIEPAVGTALAEYDAAIAEVEGMAAALEFYADPWEWQDRRGIGPRHPDFEQTPDFYDELEFGKRALAAIQRGVRT